VFDAVLGERVYLINDGVRRAEGWVAVQRFRAERTAVGTATGGFHLADQVVGMVRMLFDDERTAGGPAAEFVVVAHPVVESL
jgi:hypothetical protein